MGTPPTGVTAHRDLFVRNNLPPKAQWPELIYDLPELGYPAQTNVATELLENTIEKLGADRPLIHTPVRTWSYGNVAALSNRIARVLVEDLGLEPGNRVLLRAPNNPMMFACWLAVAKAGGIIVATMPLLRARELSTIADKAQIRLALCDQRLAGDLESAECASLERIVLFDAEASDGELNRLAETKSPTFATVPTAIDDPVLIAFTSGTTGKPKGTIHFHRDILASADAFFCNTVPAGPDDVFFGTPPLAFTFGLGMLMIFPMRVGASVALVEKPSPEAVVETCERFGVSVMATAPTAYRAILPMATEKGLSRLRHAISAGETLPLPTYQAWKSKLNLSLIDGLGATELFHIFITSVGEQTRPGATGKPVTGYQARIVGADGTPAPTGQVGRLAVRGPTGCRYLADERQTSYVQRGWNLTGDAYHVDEDGYYWFDARADDMIISAGYNISGPEVEEALLAHQAVKDCAVVASPDEDRGNIVKAFVVIDENSRDSRPDLGATLQDFVKERIAPYKYPRAIEFVDALPRTETGKIQRFKLRQQETKTKD